MPIITVASNKGGVGKTTIAIELAYALQGVLVDLDHDDGGATAGWLDVGSLAPLYSLRWLTGGDGPGPRVLHRDGLPDLIPSHPDYGTTVLSPETVTERLNQLAAQVDHVLVVDCHPGFDPKAIGAMAASHLVIVPVVLAERELRSFSGLVREFAGYPLGSIPSRVPRWGDYHQAAIAPFHERWRHIADAAGVAVGPTISEWREWPRRRSHRALLASGRVGQWSAAAQDELRAVAEWATKELAARV